MTSGMTWVILDGELLPVEEARIPVTSQGVLYGRGVFETFRASPLRPVYRLGRHLARLAAGAETLGLTMPRSTEGVAEAVDRLLERSGIEDARVRITLAARGGAPSQPLVFMEARRRTDYPERLFTEGASAMVAGVRRNETSPLSRIKSLNCLDNILAREAARASGADEALLLNTAGPVAEGSVTNVFIVRGETLITPPLSDGCLPGVTREAVIEMARKARIKTREASIAVDEVKDADEAFLTNAVAGVLPLVSVDGKKIGAGVPGEATRQLRALYDDAITCSAG